MCCKSFSLPAFSAFLLTALAAGVYTLSVSADPGDTAPNGRHIGTKDNHGPSGDAGVGKAQQGSNGISYHGGPLLTGGPTVYYIWYGNWAADKAAEGILTALPTGLSGSPYFRINTTYYNASKVFVANAVNFSSANQFTFPSASTTYGTSLTDATVQKIVSDTINVYHGLAYDSNGVYFVLTSPEVKETSGFCSKYCGWHTHFALNGVSSNDVKYAFIGDAATQCPSSCEEQTATSPNKDPGVDGMASVIAHELEESTTDPDLNAWYDTKGYENADKCAWTFGTEKTLSSGAKYNMTLNGLNFLIQQNWVNAGGGYCALSY